MQGLFASSLLTQRLWSQRSTLLHVLSRTYDTRHRAYRRSIKPSFQTTGPSSLHFVRLHRELLYLTFNLWCYGATSAPTCSNFSTSNRLDSIGGSGCQRPFPGTWIVLIVSGEPGVQITSDVFLAEDGSFVLLVLVEALHK